MPTPKAAQIPLPKFLSRRPPSIAQTSLPQQRGINVAPTQTATVTIEDGSTAIPQVEQLQEKTTRGRKPRDNDCIGLKFRFSRLEKTMNAPSRDPQEYVPQSEVQKRRKETIQDRFHKIVTEVLQETSSLYVNLQESRHQEAGIRKAAKGAPSTGERMLDQWRASEDLGTRSPPTE